MDMYAALKDLTARVEALEAQVESNTNVIDVMVSPPEEVDFWPDPETASEIDEAMTLAVEPVPYESSEEQAQAEAEQEAEVDEAVEAALSPEAPYVGHVEPAEVIEDVADQLDELSQPLVPGGFTNVQQDEDQEDESPV